MAPGSSNTVQPASLIVTDPSGNRSRIPLDPVPFRIGRSPDSELVLRDSRASRAHSRIVAETGEYLVEDCGSLHGTYVNGQRVGRHALKNGDRIEFGAQDSYQLEFALDGAELRRLMDTIGVTEKSPLKTGNLGKLRAILDLARTLQGSFSIDDVLVSVVDTALAITGAERGFLLLREGESLEQRVARARDGKRLHADDLRVPRDVLQRALQNRRELLSMNFDPFGTADTQVGKTVMNLELRSVICVPIVRMRTGQGENTNIIATASETVGVLYMDSRAGVADLAGGNREILQTLAIEASTVLENARLLEEERAKQHLEEELRLARTIQQSLLPATLPKEGWLLARGSSVASLQVGGDYFDVARVNEECWSAVVTDVSGKGVGSALLASLFQGALIANTPQPNALRDQMQRLNTFLIGRTGGEKYATVFGALLHKSGRLSYVNAAHCPPILVRATGALETLEPTSVPVGLMEIAEFETAETRLHPGEKLVIYSDGVTEAQNSAGDFFGRRRLRDVLTAHAYDGCSTIHDSIQEAVAAFTDGAVQSDDITVLVLEFNQAA